MPTAEVLKTRAKLPEMEAEIRIHSLDWASIARRDVPPFNWIIPHWLSLHPTLLAGAGGVGKSLLAQAMGTALATGRPFIGDIARPYNVGLFMCEDDQDELHRRQAAINGHFGVDWQDLGHLHIAVREGVHNVLYESQLGELRFTSNFQMLREWVNDERIEVPPFMIEKLRKNPENLFVLKVMGDSMLQDGILEGDYVIIRKQKTAENGQKVVALIEGGATIKRFYKVRDRIELHSANPKYAPIVLKQQDHFEIEGIFVGLIRVDH